MPESGRSSALKQVLVGDKYCLKEYLVKCILHKHLNGLMRGKLQLWEAGNSEILVLREL
jgi:hypothetical protein